MDHLEITRQAIARAVERGDGTNDDRILRAVDPALAAALDALPVGWEVSHYTQQQQAAARAMRSVLDNVEGVTIMSESEAVVETVDAPVAPLVVDENARQAALVSEVMAHVAYMFRTYGGKLNYMIEDDGHVLVDLDGTDGVRVFGYHQKLYGDTNKKQFATYAAKMLSHALSEWTFTGDDSIGHVARCHYCGELAYMPKEGGRGGRIFSQRCTGAPGLPGSLAGVKAHMDRAGAPAPDENPSDPRRWTENEDIRR